MFISRADSNDQRIDYHLTYPSSPRALSLAYGVAETNNSRFEAAEVEGRSAPWFSRNARMP